MNPELTGAAWRTSSHSGSSDCVEVAVVAGGMAVRDSKDPGGAVLRFTAAEWRAFLAGVRDGEFDLAPDGAPIATGP